MGGLLKAGEGGGGTKRMLASPVKIIGLLGRGRPPIPTPMPLACENFVD